jgi:Tol biopolymer transport system component
LTATVLEWGYLKPESARPVHASILPPEDSGFAFGGGNAPLTISPDGHEVAFTASIKGRAMLWLQVLDEPFARILPGTEDAAFPFWSPDGRTIGFFSEGRLKKMNVTGGSPQILCDAPDARGGSWSSDGVILIGFANKPIHKVAATGGVPAAILKIDNPDKVLGQSWPYFLTDGRHFLYLSVSVGEQIQGETLFLGQLDSTESKLLMNTHSGAAYAEGYLFFTDAQDEKTLIAQRFDYKAGKLTGDRYPIASRLRTDFQNRLAAFSVSASSLVYQSSTQESGEELLLIGRDGKKLNAFGKVRFMGGVRLSPDASRAAVWIIVGMSKQGDIAIYDLSSKTRKQFTFDPSYDVVPVWSPTGDRIVFASNRKGQYDLFEKPSNGVTEERLLLSSNLDKVPRDWSRDGKYLLYSQKGAKAKADLWVLPISTQDKPFPFLETEHSEDEGAFSPDGRWVAYVSDESGRDQIHVAPFPRATGKFVVSTEGGRTPRWRQDGKELYFMSNDNHLMAVAVTLKGETLEFGTPQALFATQAKGGGFPFCYDVSPDGKLFAVDSTDEVLSIPASILLNWTAALKK